VSEHQQKLIMIACVHDEAMKFCGMQNCMRGVCMGPDVPTPPLLWNGVVTRAVVALT
jgi:hypothetical protein